MKICLLFPVFSLMNGGRDSVERKRTEKREKGCEGLRGARERERGGKNRDGSVGRRGTHDSLGSQELKIHPLPPPSLPPPPSSLPLPLPVEHSIDNVPSFERSQSFIFNPFSLVQQTRGLLMYAEQTRKSKPEPGAKMVV